MAPAVEVVGEAKSESAAEITLYCQICLLRVGEHEVLRLGITERLEKQWEAVVDIVLV
jgi:hypothetical protein